MKLKRKIFATVLFFLLWMSAFAQTGRKISENEKAALEKKMFQELQQVKTLQCNFVQEKSSSLVIDKAVAKGMMIYQAPSLFRWAYSEPTPSTLILSGNSAVLFDKNGERIGNEGMLRQLGTLIISMINGSSFTQQNRQFTAEFYERDNERLLVVLTPVQRRLRDLYNKIELHIDPKTMLANDITLYEKSGDMMVITMTNKVLNSDIPPNKFATK